MGNVAAGGLSRAPIVEDKKEEFDEWMAVLNDRYPEHEAALSRERQAFEATFKHREADRTLRTYHLSLTGVDGGGLDESLPSDAVHAAYSRQEPGWEELTPRSSSRAVDPETPSPERLPGALHDCREECMSVTSRGVRHSPTVVNHRLIGYASLTTK